MLILLLILKIGLLSACPSECVCEYDRIENIFSIDCNDRKLKSFPVLFDLGLTREDAENRTKTIDATTPDDRDPPPAKEHERVGWFDFSQKVETWFDLGNKEILDDYVNYPRERREPEVHIFANGNRFTYLLQSKMRVLEGSRVSVLELERNEHVMDIAPDLFDDSALQENLQKLKIGPITGEHATVLLQRVGTFKALEELSITRAPNTFQNQGVRTTSHPRSVCEVNTSKLPATLRVLRISNFGDVHFYEESHYNHVNISLRNVTLTGVGLKHTPRFVVEIVDTTLQYLDLSHNSLKSIFGDQTQHPKESNNRICQLVSLNLSYNNIETLDGVALGRCQELKFVDLSHNALLSEIGPYLLQGLSFVTLDLSYTEVRSIRSIHSNTISEVRLFQTPLQCLCDNVHPSLILDHHKVKGTCSVLSSSTNSAGKYSNPDLKEVLQTCQNEQEKQRHTKFSLFSFQNVDEHATEMVNDRLEMGMSDQVEMHSVQLDSPETILDLALRSAQAKKQAIVTQNDAKTEDCKTSAHEKNHANPNRNCKEGESVKNKKTIVACNEGGRPSSVRYRSVFVYVACMVHAFLIFALFMTAGHGSMKSLGSGLL